jgi:hypothetical protein
MKKEPRYRKDGMIYEQDRHYLAQGWPERRGPKVPAYQPAPAAVHEGNAVPDPMKRKGRC